jgi:LysR family transcriptional regulator, benzoate and cis,cis-muconate-responsive activator of ben and cat genes
MMDLKDLKAFLVVAQELNFRKASEILHITQPPLTRLISKLEEDLGVKLFQRTTRKVELTGAGLYLVQQAEKLLGQSEAVEREVRKIGKLKTGELVIGIAHQAFHSAVPRMLTSYKGQFPTVRTSITEKTTTQLLRDLRLGKIDIAFCDNPETSSFEKLEVHQQEMGFVLPIGHRYYHRKFLRLEDLSGETLIFHGKDDTVSFQTDFHQMLRKKGLEVKIYYRKPGESCLNLVSLEKGILLSVKTAAVGFKFIPLIDFSKRFKVYGVWPKDQQSLALKAFLQFLNESIELPKTHLDNHLSSD